MEVAKRVREVFVERDGFMSVSVGGGVMHGTVLEIGKKGRNSTET